jgi:hypothetical protein
LASIYIKNLEKELPEYWDELLCGFSASGLGMSFGDSDDPNGFDFLNEPDCFGMETDDEGIAIGDSMVRLPARLELHHLV